MLWRKEREEEMVTMTAKKKVEGKEEKEVWWNDHKEGNQEAAKHLVEHGIFS